MNAETVSSSPMIRFCTPDERNPQHHFEHRARMDRHDSASAAQFLPSSRLRARLRGDGEEDLASGQWISTQFFESGIKRRRQAQPPPAMPLAER
jgi:hypothetical protein